MAYAGCAMLGVCWLRHAAREHGTRFPFIEPFVLGTFFWPLRCLNSPRGRSFLLFWRKLLPRPVS